MIEERELDDLYFDVWEGAEEKKSLVLEDDSDDEEGDASGDSSFFDQTGFRRIDDL